MASNDKRIMPSVHGRHSAYQDILAVRRYWANMSPEDRQAKTEEMGIRLKQDESRATGVPATAMHMMDTESMPRSDVGIHAFNESQKRKKST